jgi:hypothetical protein
MSKVLLFGAAVYVAMIVVQILSGLVVKRREG